MKVLFKSNDANWNSESLESFHEQRTKLLIVQMSQNSVRYLLYEFIHKLSRGLARER